MAGSCRREGLSGSAEAEAEHRICMCIRHGIHNRNIVGSARDGVSIVRSSIFAGGGESGNPHRQEAKQQTRPRIIGSENPKTAQ